MDKQYGFLPGRSSSVCNTISSNFIPNVFKSHSQVDDIYLDFAKALDILAKNEPLLSLFKLFLKGRILHVKYRKIERIFDPYRYPTRRFFCLH